MAADTFTLFPHLPLELQLQIWTHAVLDDGFMHYYTLPSFSASTDEDWATDFAFVGPHSGKTVYYGADCLPNYRSVCRMAILVTMQEWKRACEEDKEGREEVRRLVGEVFGEMVEELRRRME